MWRLEYVNIWFISDGRMGGWEDGRLDDWMITDHHSDYTKVPYLIHTNKDRWPLHNGCILLLYFLLLEKCPFGTLFEVTDDWLVHYLVSQSQGNKNTETSAWRLSGNSSGNFMLIELLTDKILVFWRRQDANLQELIFTIILKLHYYDTLNLTFEWFIFQEIYHLVQNYKHFVWTTTNSSWLRYNQSFI
jgi:hypothetical protein